MRRIVLLALCLSGCARQTPDALYRTADTLLKKGQLPEALAAANAGLRVESSWRFRLLKADVLVSMNEGEKAMETLGAAPPPSAPEMRALFAMQEGYAQFLLSDYPAAEKALNQAREIARPLATPLLDAQIALRRGPLEERLGHPAIAEELFRGVLATAVAQDDLYLQARAIGNLGFFFLDTYRYDQAIYWLARAREAFERLGATSSVPKAIGNLGWCYYRLGDDEQALKYLHEAEQRSELTRNRYELQVWLGDTGSVLLDRNDFSGAIDNFERALAIAKSLGEKYWTGWWEFSLALAAIQFRDFDSAERHNNEALRLRQNMKDSSDFYPRVNQARIMAGRNDAAGAEKLFLSLIDQPSDDPTPVIDAESELAELLIKTGDTARADAQFRSALSLIERQRASLTREDYKLSYFSGLIRFYQDYVDFLVSSGQTAKALEVAESSRARVLDEKLHDALHNTAQAREVSSAALQQIAKTTNSVLLSYWLAPKRSFLWVVTPTGVTWHELPAEKKINALVEAYASLVENLRDPLDSESPAGRELAQILLDPVRKLLQDQTRIILVPDRALHSLNFETLPDPDQPSRYLIERATISIAPSLGVVAGAAETAGTENSILMIGDPEPAVEEYQRLPYASKEMTLIEQKFAASSGGRMAGHSVVLEGARAYPAAYRDNDPSKFSFIHFAAHAAANRESPLDSALILSRHDSGYTLSARDVMNVPLHAELVTLSACRSAGARAYSGEGPVGLSWAFLRAGARNVVAGLWDVNDLSTASLMADFYGRLTAGAAPADALRKAKLALAHSTGAYRKPFYWGPFQLYTGSAK
jgi:CHAT domain-containing protein/Flp pilus assembly protein TadD